MMKISNVLFATGALLIVAALLLPSVHSLQTSSSAPVYVYSLPASGNCYPTEASVYCWWQSSVGIGTTGTPISGGSGTTGAWFSAYDQTAGEWVDYQVPMVLSGGSPEYGYWVATFSDAANATALTLSGTYFCFFQAEDIDGGITNILIDFSISNTLTGQWTINGLNMTDPMYVNTTSLTFAFEGSGTTSTTVVAGTISWIGTNTTGAAVSGTISSISEQGGFELVPVSIQPGTYTMSFSVTDGVNTAVINDEVFVGMQPSTPVNVSVEELAVGGTGILVIGCGFWERKKEFGFEQNPVT